MKYQQSICRRKSQTKKETQCDANILSKCLAYSIIQLYFGNYARCKLTPQRTYRLWVQLTCLENHAGPGCIPRASTHPSRQPSKQKPDVPQCGPFTGSFLRREGCVKMSSDAMLYFCIPAQLSVIFLQAFGTSGLSERLAFAPFLLIPFCWHSFLFVSMPSSSR